MTLQPGTKLGPYEVVATLGAGGMGEVYRARDTRLNRDVALKVLPAAVASNPERLARFEREAQVLASLNHPNIAAIYGLEESGSVRALVMELVEGPTLADKIHVAQGPPSDPAAVRIEKPQRRTSGIEEPQRRRAGVALQLDEALPIAKQIADALEAAHERGIIHRDLKPANIKITPEGTVKVLDFGLAKALDVAAASSSATSPLQDSPTISALATQAGVILGTAVYMPPEQAKGKTVDRRADIWAFGCVLYEMLAAKQAFEGETVTDVLAAVVRAEPEWNALPATMPPAMVRLTRRCLEKDLKRRLQAIGEARIAIEETLSGADSVAAGLSRQEQAGDVKSPLQPFWRRALPWAIAVTATIAAVILAFVTVHLLLQPKTEESVIRFSVSPPENAVFHPLGGLMNLSPDGRQLAFVAIGKDGQQQLWIRALSELTARPLQGTDNAWFSFWSPDGRTIAFYADGKLKKVGVSGGPVQTLADAPSGAGGGTWNREGVIVFTNQHRLYCLSEAGGAPTLVAAPDAARQEVAYYYYPQFLPDGRHFLFFGIWPGQPQDFIEVGSLDSRETKRLLGADSTALYAPPGYLLYVREGALMARRFDVKRLEFTADAIPIAEDVGSYTQFPLSYFSVSPNGVLAYQAGASSVTNQMVWFDRKGAKLGSVGEAGMYTNPAISPDGTKLAVGLLGSKIKARDIWVYDLNRGTGSPLTFDPADGLDPAWSPDGSQIMFTSEHRGERSIYEKPANGLGSAESISESGQQVANVSDLSRDGRYVMYNTSVPPVQLWALPLFGQHRPFAFAQGNFSTGHGQFSPDGRFVAYASNETGRSEVYVQTFPEHQGKWQVSTAGGTEPMWRRDGKELLYLRADDKVMAVEVKTDSAQFGAGIPKPIFQAQLIAKGSLRNRYVVTPDGQRFLMLVPAVEAKPSPITVVVNWPALLKNSGK